VIPSEIFNASLTVDCRCSDVFKILWDF